MLRRNLTDVFSSGTVHTHAFAAPPTRNMVSALKNAETESSELTIDPVGLVSAQLGTPVSDSSQPKLTDSAPRTKAGHRRNSYGGRLAALAMAAAGDVESMARLYRKTPEKLLAADRNGETPAHMAVRCGHLNVVMFLLESVPSLFTIKDRRLKLPVNYATANKNGTVRSLPPMPMSCLYFQFFEFSETQEILELIQRTEPSFLGNRSVSDCIQHPAEANPPLTPNALPRLLELVVTGAPFSYISDTFA